MSPKNSKLLPRISHSHSRPPFSIESPDAPHVPGETKPRRNSKLAGKLELLSSPNEKIKTAYDIVNWAAESFGDKHAFGVRMGGGQAGDAENKTSEPGGGSVTYKYTTYREYQALVRDVGSGLRAVGLERTDKILIYAATSPMWLAVAHGASSQSMVFVTAYEALGPAGLEHSLRSTEAKAVFVDQHLFPKVASALSSKPLPHVRVVVTSGPPAEAAVAPGGDAWEAGLLELKASRPGLRILDFADLQSAGRREAFEPTPPGREDLCAIYYTSGSTGTPKGVPAKHKAVAAAVAGLDSVIGEYLSPADSFMAYLPLAHVLEFAFENSCLFWGVTMGYGSARTLFDHGTPSGERRAGDLRAFRPTFMIGVPAVWERIRKAVLAERDRAGGAGAGGGLLWGRAALWAWWLAAKGAWLACGLPWPGDWLGDAAAPGLRAAAAAAVGPRLRFAMSGGGPLAESTQRFLSMAVAPLVNGYGLTETMAMGGLMDPQEWHTGSLGSIPASIEMKLVDYPEAGYLTSNDPPQGEIWIRGDSVMERYYDDDDEGEGEETSGAVAPGGWLRSGDIGQWEPNGHFRIVDRKKNLVKTLNGEYIALEKLESVYRSAPLVANICIYASPARSRPLAIVIPSPLAVGQLAARRGLDPTAKASELMRQPDVVEEALAQLRQVGKQAGLVSIELVEAVVLVGDLEWSPQNGLTTAVGKLNRPAIVNRYQTLIEACQSTK